MDVSFSGPRVVVAKMEGSKVKRFGFSAPVRVGFRHKGSNFCDLGRKCRVNWVGLKANRVGLKTIRAETAMEKNQEPFRKDKVHVIFFLSVC
jgi:hypothetical protein